MSVHRARGLIKVTQAIAVSAGGAFDNTADPLGPVFGELVSVEYKPGTLDTGADITLTDNVTGAPILTLTNAGTANRKFRPTTVVTDNLGVAVTPAASAVDLNRAIFLAGPVRVVVAQGGVSLAGSISLIVAEIPARH